MGGVVDTLFGRGGGKGYEDLQKYIGRGMDERRAGEGRAEEALSPYMGDPRIQQQYEKYLAGGADPQALYNQMMSGYQQSPFAKAQTEAGMNAVQHAGAASGMHGSGDEMTALQENAQKISSADMQDYLNHMLGMRSDYMNRLGGLQGQESEHQYGARGQVGGWRYGLGNQLAEDYGAQGKARANEDMARAGGWDKLFGAIPGIGSMLPGKAGHFFQGLGDIF